MQLVNHHRPTGQTMSPAIYAALVGSLFQNPAPMFAGAACAAIAAVMTALKTGNELLWPCAALLILTGAIRSFDMAKYKNRHTELTAGEASRWEVRYQIGAMLYAMALGAWCAIALLMSDDAVAQYQKDSLTGHRPTWKIGMNSPINEAAKRRARHSEFDEAVDPFNVFKEAGGRWRAGAEKPQPETRSIRNAERKALHSLGLEHDATKADVRTAFKALVKQHHPDTNGGDRSTEDRLRDIIQAYKYLKSVGFA